MLSAPFDNWWHDAYGLDVKILSPPHTVLALGMLGVAAGVLLLMASLQNRAVAGDHVVGLPFIFMCGVMLTMVSIFLTEHSFPNQQRSREFYIAACLTYPMYLAAAARGSKRRWPATTAALVYAGIVLTMLWVLPLFAAEPKLAPVYRKIDRMVPPPFPLLLVVPALAMDLSLRFFGKQRGFWRDTLLGRAAGIVVLRAAPADAMVLRGVSSEPAGGQLVLRRRAILPLLLQAGFVGARILAHARAQ
jgi:hypothetical protein